MKFEDFSSTKTANNAAGILASELAIQRLSKEYADIQSKLNNYRANKKDQAQRRKRHYEEELAKFEAHVKTTMDDAIIRRNQLILGAVVGLVSTFFSNGLWFVFGLITVGLLILAHFVHKRTVEVQLESGPIPPKLNDNLPDAEETFLVSKLNNLRYELNKHEDIVRQPLNS